MISRDAPKEFFYYYYFFPNFTTHPSQDPLSISSSLNKKYLVSCLKSSQIFKIDENFTCAIQTIQCLLMLKWCFQTNMGRCFMYKFYICKPHFHNPCMKGKPRPLVERQMAHCKLNGEKWKVFVTERLNFKQHICIIVAWEGHLRLA